MRLRQNGRSWMAELDDIEKAVLKGTLEEAFAAAGTVVEIRDPDLSRFWMEVDLELNRPVAFNTSREQNPVWINRDGGGVSFSGSRNWYRLGLVPMPMPGDTKITVRLYLSVQGSWWPEEGPESRDVRIEDVLEQVRLFGQALANGWDPAGQPRRR